jgi:hypothetical protein
MPSVAYFIPLIKRGYKELKGEFSNSPLVEGWLQRRRGVFKDSPPCCPPGIGQAGRGLKHSGMTAFFIDDTSCQLVSDTI